MQQDFRIQMRYCLHRHDSLQVAGFVHLLTMAFEQIDWPVLIYIRNQFLGFAFLCSCIQILDFLSFHHLFGPWAIIISSLLVDTGKFLAVLMLFELGFSMLILAMNQPYFALTELSDDDEQTKTILETNDDFVPNPIHAFEKLFFSLFGLTSVNDLKMTKHIGDWTMIEFKLVFGLYLLIAQIVLINLLIAMMSDTYQRIQVSVETIAIFSVSTKTFSDHS